MYFYIQSEPTLWTVGYEDQTGKWHPDSDHESRELAAEKVATLNGFNDQRKIQELEKRLEVLEKIVFPQDPEEPDYDNMAQEMMENQMYDGAPTFYDP